MKGISRWRPHPLAVLLVAFAALVLLHGWATPLFEAPDEVWHYAYVAWLAEGNGLPSMTDDSSGANQEVAQPPLYYAVAAALRLPFPDDDLEQLFWHNPHFGYQAPGTTVDNKNMLIHTPQERYPGGGAVLAVRAARLASLLFGLLTIVAVWELSLETFDNRRAALLTASLVAFHPQFVFMSSVVSNDSAAAALSTAALWSFQRLLRRGSTARRAALAGLLAGLAVLTKTSALLLLPLGGACLLWQALGKTKNSSQGRLRDLTSRKTAVQILSFGLTALFTAGWWYLRNLILYADPMGISNHVNTLWGRTAPVTLLALFPEFPLLVRSFWAAYGWGHVWWPDWLYVVLTLLATAILGRTSWLTAQGLIKRTLIPRTRTAALLNAAWFLGIVAALLHWMRQVEAPHGRLLLPAIGAWALLLTIGLKHPGPLCRYVEKALLTLLVVTALLAPGARILATFAPPRLRTATAISDQSVLQYGNEALLLNTTVEGPGERYAPGDDLRVRACWQALRPITDDYTMFVQLLGPENAIIASRRTFPGLGRFPTSLWPTDRAFCDVITLTLPDNIDVPLRALLEIGLYNAATGERLSAQKNGAPAEPPVVSTVVIAAKSTNPPTPPKTPAVQFSDTATLIGYHAPREVHAGRTLTITLQWKAQNTVQESLIAFVHLWQPGEPEAYAQHDGPPRNGWFPTTEWQSGDIIPDIHLLDVPADLPPGEYPLWAGLYSASNGTRLPATENGSPLPDALAPLGTVRVTTP